VGPIVQKTWAIACRKSDRERRQLGGRCTLPRQGREFGVALIHDQGVPQSFGDVERGLGYDFVVHAPASG
jgi:hypothetical protein